ncbi:MAG: hypothetical protein JO076_07375 [Verrucomicrobia bacterium]|nr:hypothetical protein [Verrucomicrobiota bacterium]
MKSILAAAKLAGASVSPISLRALTLRYGLENPISILDLVGLIESPPITFHQDVVTPSGTALGGWVEMTLRSDASYTFSGHMHDSGWDPYDFRVRAVVSTPDIAVAAQHSGHTDGTGSSPFGSPNRDNDWSESGTEPRIQQFWSELRQATMTVSKSYQDTGLLHAVEDLFNDFLGFLVASVVFGPHLAEVIVIGNELGEITGVKFGSPSVLEGVIVTALKNPVPTAVSVFVFGPGIVIPAIVAGIVNAPRHRSLSPEEIVFASKVFDDTLPTDRIVLTDMSGLNGRGFTFPNIDGTILVNIGSAYDDPIHYRLGMTYATQGQLFIHELTHSWQIAHGWFIAGWICSALDAQIFQGPSAYNVGPAGPPYSDFGIEAQAVIVDRWFGTYASSWQTMDDVENKLKSSVAISDPYFGYIADNIRLGQT